MTPRQRRRHISLLAFAALWLLSAMITGMPESSPIASFAYSHLLRRRPQVERSI